ncbi:mechanosensitive ion channel [Akkermansiaceae bacterium]|nr:mechanosensitive ion channel [Akkermansiaceae bacterium]
MISPEKSGPCETCSADLKIPEPTTRITNTDPRVTQDPPPMALFRSHGASSLDFELRVYIPELADRVWVEDSITTEINKVLIRENIEIPFPQQDVNIREIAKSSEDA